MSQESVSEIISNHYPRFLKVSEIMELTTLSRRSIFRALKDMIKHHDVEYLIIKSEYKSGGWEKQYRIRREPNGTTKQ